METTVRGRLQEALEDLEDEELKNFKAKLNEIPLRDGYANIPRGTLQKADRVDLSQLLVSYYTEAYAPQVAARALEGINLRRQAEKLRSVTGIGENGSVQAPVQPFHGASGRCGPRAPVSEEPHFVDKHRAALIERTSTVEAVLDQLHGSILDDGQYQRIVSWSTNEDKMRELYRLTLSWNRSCKDRLYEALKAKNKFLIEDLEGR